MPDASSPVAAALVMPDFPRLADHHIAGKATVPAVELLELLARSVEQHVCRDEAWGAPLAMTDALFPRFLPAEEIPRCAFQVDLETNAHGVRAVLRSRIDLPGGMQRSREHAAATFDSAMEAPPPPPAPATNYEISAERIYADLIPFGPRYRNLRGDVVLGASGGCGVVRSPADGAASDSRLLGCPFLLDAAMHLACVWGQRYAGYVAYPTGFASRLLITPVSAGERRCMVFPRRVEARRLSCDLWLYDERGEPCDVVLGLDMSSLSAGVSPPEWFVARGNA